MKLLNKSLRLYLFYAFAILFIAVPLFYIAIESIISEEIDENLAAQKKKVSVNLEKQYKSLLNPSREFLSADFQISPMAGNNKVDTFYTVHQYDSASEELLPYRVLEGSVILNGKMYKLKLQDSLIDTEDLKERIMLIMAVLLLCFIAGLYLINIYISTKTWKPFYETLKKLNDFRVDKNEKIILPATNVNEFADLNKAISSLANINQQVYQSQKEFTENASHEMQTPIAILQSKIELLMQTTPLTADQAELITVAEQTGQRISKLNKTLLLLAKIDNNQYPERGEVVLRLIAENILLQYQDAISEKNIIVDKDTMDESAIVANPLLVEILLSNLLANAVRHNYKNGTIKIVVVHNSIIVSNTGKNQALDSAVLYLRFQKQTADSESLGMGLALAKRICNLYEADLQYSFLKGVHKFSVKFVKVPLS